MISRMKSRPGTAAVPFAISFPDSKTLSMWRISLDPPRPGTGSNLGVPAVGSDRSGDGIDRRDGSEHLAHRDRIGGAAGDRVSEGFEVGADRVDGRKCKMSWVGP